MADDSNGDPENGETEEFSQSPLDVTVDEATRKQETRLGQVGKRFEGVLNNVRFWASLAPQLIQYFGVLLLLFIVHQLFIWFDRNPEAAFEQAAFGLEVAEIVWDFQSRTINMYVDILNAAVIPIWNAVSFYWVEPILVLLIEIFYQAFDTSGRPLQDVLVSDDDVIDGFSCTATSYSAEWCGRCVSASLQSTAAQSRARSKLRFVLRQVPILLRSARGRRKARRLRCPKPSLPPSIVARSHPQRGVPLRRADGAAVASAKPRRRLHRAVD